LFSLPTVLWVCGAIFLTVFLFSIRLPRNDGHLIGSDGFHYYAIIRSMALDRDLDLSNDYRTLGVENLRYPPTATGRPGSPFAIGTPLLWMPFFGVAHLLAHVLNLFGANVDADGTGYLYEAFVCAGTILFATIGLVLMSLACIRVAGADERARRAAVLALCWATPAVYYCVVEGSMSHGLTLFTNALFLLLYLDASARPTVARWAGVGASVGLAALVRWQDGIVVLLPLFHLLALFVRKPVERPRAFVSGAALGVSALAVFAPQMVMWHAIYGTFFTVPQGNDFMDWSCRYVLPTLFSTRHGLMSWHPVYLVALAGLPALYRIDRRLALAVGFVCLLHLYANGSIVQWSAGDAFGARRFISVIPFLCLPLTALVIHARDAGKQRWLSVILAALVVWNGLCFVQYRFDFVSKSDYLTLKEFTVDRVMLPFDITRRVLNR
jgi:hypothetical protein